MVILASASPQRKALLNQIGIEPEVIPSQLKEEMDPRDVRGSISRLAAQKCHSTLLEMCERVPGAGPFPIPSWIISADTVIQKESSVFGKPHNHIDAKRMLVSLSGEFHSVLTAVVVASLCNSDEGMPALDTEISTVAETLVTFQKLENSEIEWYLNTGEWIGAAGAYRIQEKGACLVESIEGSFSNVVGLPLELIYGMLNNLGYPW